MKIFTMAWRNIWRNKRRTLVTVGAMTLALWVMILYTGLIDGYLIGLERNILDLEMGDIQINVVSYRSDPSIHKRIRKPEILVSALKNKGFRASSRLLASGLAAAGDSSAGVSFIGVNVAEDKTVSNVYKKVKQGTWLSVEHLNEVVLGSRLARNLAINIGDELVVLSQGARGAMANELYIVRGILSEISDGVDRGGVFMNSGAFHELFELEEGAHKIVVRRPFGTELTMAALEVNQIVEQEVARIDNQLEKKSVRADEYFLEAKTWREIIPSMASMFDSTSQMIFVMFMIVYFAIGIVILNAMLMAVFERVREFGVLKALGVSPSGVLRLVFLESSMQTTLAVLAGLILSIPGLLYLEQVGIDLAWIGGVSISGIAWDPVWRAAISTNVFVAPVLSLVVIVSLAVLYPALKAAFIRPIRAMQQR